MPSIAKQAKTPEERFVLEKADHRTSKPWIIKDECSPAAEDPVLYTFSSKKKAVEFRDEMIAEAKADELAWNAAPEFNSTHQGQSNNEDDEDDCEPEQEYHLTLVEGDTQVTISRDCSCSSDCHDVAHAYARQYGMKKYLIDGQRFSL